MISKFNALCYKHLKTDFTAISLQLVGSIALEQNLREVLSQLDMVDVKLFFKALKLVIPSVPKSFEGQDSNRLFWVEALVRELRAPDSQEVKN